MLKKQINVLLAALAISLMLCTAALAQEIVVMNGTPFEIHGLALSDSRSDSWGEDLLGNEILNPGEGMRISVQGSPVGWDMAVMDDEGTQLEFSNLNLTNVSKVTLFEDGTAQFE
ncbi:MAG: hypothetical protein BA863_10000 [Desulfovibrio sp. S3730MH75]|nr:MAG: hypothetical protein BA863_10000 [Desulfovibrio sp. S3730MH75]